MAARVLGHVVSPAQRARRVTVLRELWGTDRSLRTIGERIGLGESAVSKLARDAGLPPRHRRDAKN